MCVCDDARSDGPDGASHNKSGPVTFNTTTHLMQLMDVGTIPVKQPIQYHELGPCFCHIVLR